VACGDNFQQQAPDRDADEATKERRWEVSIHEEVIDLMNQVTRLTRERDESRDYAITQASRLQAEVQRLREALRELLRAGTDGHGWKKADAEARALIDKSGGGK
jgi:predicted  nucleic acid-binding Zn-ribbon protein